MTAPTLDAESLRAALRRYPELSKLDHEVLEGLARGAVRQEVPRRRALFTRDQVGPGLFFMLSGEVKVSLISPEGREQLLYLAEAGMMISEGVSLDGRPSRASAFAVEESALLCVPTACVEEATAAAGPLGLALMRLIAKRADRWIDRCFDLSLRTVDQRLARFLLELAPPETDEGEYVVPRERDVATIAAMLGSVREEVTRAQRRLQEAGVIDVSRRQIKVIDRAALTDVLLD